jgi:hypothetical protein
VNNDIIKKSIRWKRKQLNTLKHQPYFAQEEERKKKVLLKFERKKRLDDFDLLIYNLTNSTASISERISRWKEKGGIIDPFLVADNNNLHEDFDWNYDEANDLGTEVSSTLSLELSKNPSEPAAEGKDPKFIFKIYSTEFFTPRIIFFT